MTPRRQCVVISCYASVHRLAITP